MSRTALEISPEEWKMYDPAAAMSKRTAAQHVELSRRKRQAMRLAKIAADLLKREFSAKKVILFGSLTQVESFTPWSDIDLAAWGIPQEKFYSAVANVTSLSSDFKIDLIAPEDCHPELLASIKSQGKPL